MLPIQAPSMRTWATRLPPSSATAMFMGCPISAAFFSAAAIIRRASSSFTADIRPPAKVSSHAKYERGGFRQYRVEGNLASLAGSRRDWQQRWIFTHQRVTVEVSGRGTQVERERSAKPLCVGSIPTRASNTVEWAPGEWSPGSQGAFY